MVKAMLFGLRNTSRFDAADHSRGRRGKERRRRWSTEEKLRIVAESLRAGASVSWVAQRHGLRSNQLFKWRKLAREGVFGPFPADFPFVPVRIIGDEAGPSLRSSPQSTEYSEPSS